MPLPVINDDRYHEISLALLDMGIGRTKVIFDRVVTRWSEFRWELDSFGTSNLSDLRTATINIPKSPA